jgi:hypothetical protein
MRCQCCNSNLSDYESVLRHPETLEYLDICRKCLKDIPINPLVPADLVETSDPDEFSFDDDMYIEDDEDDE